MGSGKRVMMSDEEIAQFTYDSMALEGSTVSLAETRRIVQQVKAERGLGPIRKAGFLGQTDRASEGSRGM